MLKKLVLISLLIAIYLIGCVTKVDCLSEFKVSGNIISKKTSLPMEGAKVYFIDKGFDNHRSKIENSREIGETDASGTINDNFEYFWGYDSSMFHKEPLMTFEILVLKQGFKEKRFFFKTKELERSGNSILIPLGVIHLESE